MFKHVMVCQHDTIERFELTWVKINKACIQVYPKTNLSTVWPGKFEKLCPVQRLATGRTYCDCAQHKLTPRPYGVDGVNLIGPVAEQPQNIVHYPATATYEQSPASSAYLAAMRMAGASVAKKHVSSGI